MTLRFRPGIAADLPACRELIRQAFLPLVATLPSRPSALDEDEANLQARLAAGEKLYLLEREGQALACLFALPHAAGGIEFKRVCTHPDWQGQGLGRQLLLGAEARLREQGVNAVRLSTRASLPGNLRFYQSLGYRELARGPHPKAPHDRIIVLEKTL